MNKGKALVLGKFVNSLSIVRELGEAGVTVWLFSEDHGIAHKSKYVSRSFIKKCADDEEIIRELEAIGKTATEKLTLFPTHDHHVSLMGRYWERLEKHFLLSVNPKVTEDIISKEWQYNLCEAIGVPYPKTLFCGAKTELSSFIEEAESLTFPAILKPFSRAKDSNLGERFRVITVNSYSEFKAVFEEVPYLKEGQILLSEVIPGGDDQIWAYTAFLPVEGKVLSGWTGRKLTQYPPNFGVFASSESVVNKTVENQGIKLLEATGHVGIGEPEFKFDYRDGKYKLMEINPRLMMWHMCGHLAGVNLPYMQHLFLRGESLELEKVNKTQDTEKYRFVFFTHEIVNLVKHYQGKESWKNLFNSVTYRNCTYATFWVTDWKPGFYELFDTIVRTLRAVISKCRR